MGGCNPTDAAPHELSRKLHEVLGDEAAEAMIEWMNRVDTKLDELRHDLNTGLADVRRDLNTGLADVRLEMNTNFADVRQEMRVGFAKAEAAAAHRHADFMKWTMGFWAVSLVTYVGALVALANVLK